MTQSAFDVLILGDGPGGRMAGALLARAGCRVLALRSADAPAPAWFFSSLVLERLLDQLDGRAVLGRPLHFQYLSGAVRLDLHGRDPLAAELRREYPGAAETVAKPLEDLQELGEKLGLLLWEHGGLPVGKGVSRWGLFGRLLRQGLTPGRLNTPLAERLRDQESPAAAGLLRGLLSGLALAPADSVSLAEAALLWHGVLRPHGVSVAGLDELLLRRFRQFHGAEEDLATLQGVEPGTAGCRLTFKGRAPVTAGRIVLAGPPPGCQLPGYPPDAPAQPLRLGLAGQVSPVLAEHLVVDGTPPVRLALDGRPGEQRLTVEAAAAADPDELATRLESLLPFALGAPPAAGPHGAPPPAPGLSAAAGRLAPARHLLDCGPRVLPALGPAGEILAGYSVAAHILRGLKKPLA